MVEGPRMGMAVPLSKARPSYSQRTPQTLSDQRPFGPNGCGVGDRWPRLPRWHWAVGAPEGLDLATSPHHPPALCHMTAEQAYNGGSSGSDLEPEPELICMAEVWPRRTCTKADAGWRRFFCRFLGLCCGV